MTKKIAFTLSYNRNRKSPIDVFLFLETERVSRSQLAKRNAEVVLKFATVYPFRLRGKSLLCVYCHEEYEEPNDYRQHMNDCHQSFTLATAFAHCSKGKDYPKVDCTNIKCRECGDLFETIAEVANHIYHIHEQKILNLNYDIGLQPYKLQKDKWVCYLCGEKLASLTTLCRHTTSHYLKYTCDMCGRSYMTFEALKYHIRCSHSGKNVCRKCWTEFPTLQDKRDHIRATPSCMPFCCLNCGERFLSWELKQKHLVSNHGHPARDYSCPECEEKFSVRKRFYNHYKLTHTDSGFVCSCCGLKFGTKGQLDDHRVGHTGEKDFMCRVCLKTFSRQKSLKQHMWIHSETKRFLCVVCDKQFAQKVSLVGHMKSYHPDVDALL